ncbi:hypothetical protein [Candidatus Pelagibacter sp. HIMB1748]|uniref:hypothetical protein n=1 Tax=unclassified Candidatus Pelagibacter TaxID=2647897 RepID=UPI003F875E32
MIINLVEKKITTPILVLCFDRPEFLSKLFKIFKKCEISKIYISQDGYKGDDKLLIKRHKKVREIIKKFNYANKIKTNFFNQNLGKQIAPPKGIDWFFNHVDKGIILEDDTIPSKTFFNFCETLLKIHKKDKNIFQICGTGTLSNEFGKITYQSSLPWIHGWATWKDRWKNYNYKLNNVKKLKKNKNFSKNVPTFLAKLYWLSLFKEFNEGKHKTWDYTIAYDCLTKNLKCIKPSINMITNIGYKNKNHLANRKRYEMMSFQHLKNKKNDYINEKTNEAWIYYNLSIRYRLSLLIKYIFKII